MAEQEQSNNGSGLDPTETENRLASQKSEKQNGASEAVDQLLNAGVNQSKNNS